MSTQGKALMAYFCTYCSFKYRGNKSDGDKIVKSKQNISKNTDCL